MNTLLPVARRGRAAATAAIAAIAAIAATVLSLSLTGCGSDALDAETSAPTGQVSTSPISPTDTPTETSTDPAPTTPSPSTSSSPAPFDDPAVTLSSLGKKDKMTRVGFPGPDVVFADSSSASSDGDTFSVTTAAEEKLSVKLPASSDGWIYDISVDLGNAGTGYLITQTGGEYINTFLVVLDDGKLYIPLPNDEVIFGQFAGEGPYFETYTTNGGAHLVTQVDDDPTTGDTEYYEWSVKNREMEPSLLA